MRRQLHKDIPGREPAGDHNQQIGMDRQLHGMPVDTRMSHMKSYPSSIAPKPKNGTESRQYSPSERQIRANAFAARMHSLKYYIGLIGAKAIF